MEGEEPQQVSVVLEEARSSTVPAVYQLRQDGQEVTPLDVASAEAPDDGPEGGGGVGTGIDTADTGPGVDAGQTADAGIERGELAVAGGDDA